MFSNAAKNVAITCPDTSEAKAACRRQGFSTKLEDKKPTPKPRGKRILVEIILNPLTQQKKGIEIDVKISDPPKFVYLKTQPQLCNQIINM